MQFRAKLKLTSTVYNRWTHERRTAGRISGIQFKKVGRDYVSAEDPLPPDSVSILLRNSAVILEMTTAPVGEVVAEDPAENEEGQAENEADGEADASEADSLAALFRNGVPKSESDQEPVMRRRGRQPGIR